MNISTKKDFQDFIGSKSESELKEFLLDLYDASDGFCSIVASIIEPYEEEGIFEEYEKKLRPVSR